MGLNMVSIAEYDAWKAKQEQSNVGAASVVLSASEAKPDEVAGDMRLANDFSKATGNPVPPAPLVREYRNVFQAEIERQKSTTILSNAPRLTEWLRNPDNAAVARDDLENLSWVEGFGRGVVATGQRAGQRLQQMGNQFMFEQTAKRAADRTRTFGDLVNEQRRSGGLVDMQGNPIETWDGSEYLFALGRWVDARYAELIGTDDAKSAQEYAAAVKQNMDNIRAIPKSTIAQEFEKKAMVDADKESLGAALRNFGAATLSNPLGAISWGLETAGESGPQLLAALGTTILTRNPVAGASVGGAGSYATERYTSPAEFFKEKGVDLAKPEDVKRVIGDYALMQEAANRGVIRGLVIGSFDMVSMGVAGRSLAGNPLVEAAAQAVTQALLGAGGEYTARLAAGQEIDWNEVLAEGFGEMGTGPIDAGIAGRRFIRERGEAQAAEGRRSFFQALSGQSQASALRERMPDKFRDFVAEATKDGPASDVYVPANQFVTYFQGVGLDPFALVDTLEGVTRDDLDVALAGGGDLKIPTATYAEKIAGSEHDAFLMENMRFDPNHMTAFEAAEFNAKAEEIRQGAWEEAENARLDAEQYRQIEDQVYDRLVSELRVAGRSTEVATTEALPFQAFYRTMAERSGLTPEEFVARYMPPRVEGALPQGMQLRDTDALTRTLAEARARKAVKDTRQTLLEFISDYGGINDVGGELKHRNAETVSRGKGKKSLKLARSGVMAGVRDLLGGSSGKRFGVDDVARAVVEAGYMADDPAVIAYREAERTGEQSVDITRSLWDAIDSELRGEAQYSAQDQADPAIARAADLDQIEAYLDSIGVSLSDSDAEIKAAIEAAESRQMSGSAGVASDAVSGADLIDGVNTGQNANGTYYTVTNPGVGETRVNHTGNGVFMRMTMESGNTSHMVLNQEGDFVDGNDINRNTGVNVAPENSAYIGTPESRDLISRLAVLANDMSITAEASQAMYDIIKALVTGEMTVEQARAAAEQALGHGAPERRYAQGSGSTFYQVTPDQARAIDMPVELPTDPLFKQAVENTAGAKITDDGLLIDLVRYQKEEQTGSTSVRTGVFYLPVGSKDARHYKPKGGKSGPYGGRVEARGQTILKRPLFVKGATGGKAPEAAYDALKGKGAAAKLSDDAMGVLAVKPSAWGNRDPAKLYHAVEEFLGKYGADVSMADEIIEYSKEGNQLRYALQEHVIAHAVREAGYDSVLGYSVGRGGKGAFISEVFDVREIDYPTPGEPATLHPQFGGRTYYQRGGKTDALKEFLRWSKVKHVVYHATSADFDSFDTTRGDLGSHFGSVEQANKAVGRGRGAGASGPNIMPIYINLENPLRLKDTGTFHADGIAPQLAAKGWISKAEAKKIVAEIDADWKKRAVYDVQLRDLIKSKGHDGVVYKNEHEGRGDSWIIFDPAQAKSATGNRGTFDPSNPSLLFQRNEGGAREYPIAPRGEWYGEANYEETGGRMVYMTPDEYLSSVKVLDIDESSRDNIDDLKSHIEAGRTLDPLKIFDGGKEDGRHRAIAAKELGISRVPVVVFGDQVEKFSGLSYEQRNEAGARGSIQFPAGSITTGQSIIRLMETANLSTFTHEAGHFYLEVLKDMAANDFGTTAQDFAVVKDWWRANAADVAKDANRAGDARVTAEDVIAALDNGTTGDAAKDAAVNTGMHEQWARGLEAYFMEGKAPSSDLRAAFEKVRAWLLSIYRAISALDVKVSDELRGVFDRMLATDEQIEQAQESAGGNSPVFATAEQMGLTQEEFDRLMKLRDQAEGDARGRLLKEAMEPIRREREKWFKDERKALREEVERNINASPMFRALEWMGNRRWLGEGQPENMPDIRLSKDALVDIYGEGVLTTLRRGKQTVYAVDGGMHPDDAAGWFGFGSGDELVKALEKAPNRVEAIDAETDKLMYERHGDVLNDGTVEEKALDAVHVDKRGQWIAAELKAIADVAGSGTGMTIKEARATARSVVSQMRVRDALGANRFLAAERKAAREAQEIARQLGRDDVWLNQAKSRMQSQARKAAAGKAAPDTVATKIGEYNARFETTQSTFTVKEQQRTSQSGKAFTIPGGERTTTSLGYNDLVAKLVDAKRRQLLNHALYSEARSVAEEVGKAERFVESLGKASKRERIAGAGRRENAGIDYLAAIDELLERYDFRQMSGAAEQRRGSLLAFVEAMKAAGRENELAIPDGVLLNAGRTPYKTIAVEELRGVVDSLKNLEHVALRWDKLIDAQQQRELDTVVTGIIAAFDDNVASRPPGRVRTRGEALRNSARQFLDTVLNATTLLREIDGFKDAGAAYQGIKAPIDDAMNRLIVRKEAVATDLEGLYAPYSKEERRRMAVREHVPELGYALSKWEKIAVALNMGNEGNRQRLMDPRVRGSLTEAQVAAVLASLDERDAKFVQSVWDYVGSFWTDIAARERRVTGTEPGKVEPSPVTIAGKELRGGYYPLKYDPRLSALARDDAAQEISQSLQAGRFGKAQTKNGHTKERAQSSGRDVDLDMSVMHRHVNQVIYDLELSEAVANSWRVLQDGRIRSVFMDAGKQADFDALEIWLKDTAEGELRSADLVSRMARTFKSNFTAAKLAFNLSTAAVQISGLAQSMVVVGKRDFMRGVQASFRPGVVADITGKSAFMKSRSTTFNKDIYEFYSDPNLGPLASRWGDIKRDYIGPLSFWLMTKTQFYLVDIPTWLAGYQQGLRKFGNDEAKAVTHADDTLKRAQASGLLSDRSGIERGSLSKNSRQNDVVRLFTTLASYMFAKFNVAYERSAKAGRVIREEGVSVKSAQEVLSFTLDMAFLFTLEAVMMAAIKGKLPNSDDDEDDTWKKFLAKETAMGVMGTIPFVRDAASTFEGFDGGGAYGALTKEIAKPVKEILQGEVDKGLLKSIINTTGLATGLPATQINRAVDAEWRRREGEDVSPLEYLLGKSGKGK